MARVNSAMVAYCYIGMISLAVSYNKLFLLLSFSDSFLMFGGCINVFGLM